MKTEGLNFLEAVTAMKEGKKVKMHIWDNDYIYIKDGAIISGYTENYPFQFEWLDYTAWEIVEESWTLSDKANTTVYTNKLIDEVDFPQPYYSKEDVKEFVKRLKQRITNEAWSHSIEKTHKIIDELAGSELIK